MRGLNQAECVRSAGILYYPHFRLHFRNRTQILAAGYPVDTETCVQFWSIQYTFPFQFFPSIWTLVGAAILVVMNIFSTRERKYEIGVLTAIGIKKKQVAALFLSEILILTLAGVVVGGSAGAAVSKPLTKKLLRAQVSSSMKQNSNMQQSFGRDNNGGGPGSQDYGSGQNADGKDAPKAAPPRPTRQRHIMTRNRPPRVPSNFPK